MNTIELNESVDLFLDRALSDHQAKAILKLFRESPEMKARFIDEVVLASLAHGLSADAKTEANGVMEAIRLGSEAPDVMDLVMTDLREQTAALNVLKLKKESTCRRSVRWAIGGGIAACIAIAMFFFWEPQAKVSEFATFSQMEGAKWAKKRDFMVGSGVPLEQLELESGVVILDFKPGVRVSIEGPAAFQPVSASLMKLKEGVLTAHAGASGVGFQVETEHGIATDLGTTFEVAVEEGKSTEVYVIQGEVTFKPSLIKEAQLIKMNHGVRVSDGATKTTPKVVKRKTQSRHHKFLTGVREAGGEIRIVTLRDLRNPKQLKTFQSLAVLQEKKYVRAEGSFPLNIVEPGSYLADDLTGESTSIELSPQSVDSYLVQFNPPTSKENNTDEPYQFVGGIKFDRPIVGVVTHREEINATNSQFGRSQFEYDRFAQGGLEYADKITLSDDRCTLDINWKVTSNFENSRDQIRVIVQARK